MTVEQEVFFCDGKCKDAWKDLSFVDNGFNEHFCAPYRQKDSVMIVDGKRVYPLSWTLVTENLPVDNDLVIVSNGKLLDMARFHVYTDRGKPAYEFRTMTGHLLENIKQWMPAPGTNVTGYLDEDV